MLHEYHVIYSVRYYPRFHVTAVGLGTHYQWIRGHYSIVLCSYIGQCVLPLPLSEHRAIHFPKLFRKPEDGKPCRNQVIWSVLKENQY
jgi:hypothetical protein